MEKLYLEIYVDKKLKNTFDDEDLCMNTLTEFLWRTSVLKQKHVKVKYKYNYNDLQKVSFIESYIDNNDNITKIEYRFYNVPTKCGYLNIR